MKEQESITYYHINKDSSASFADGAYCMTGTNNNVFINFFQETPDIPSKITFYEDVRDIEEGHKVKDPMQKHQIPYWETGEGGITRIFIEKIQLTPESARRLAENILLAISDSEK